MTVFELFDMFPDEESARRWFERVRWAAGRYCGYCSSENTREVPNEKPLPYWCTDCRKYFSVKVGTPMHRSKIPLRKWVVAIYMLTTSLKGVSSMKLYRELGVSQPTAWFMIHRIREAWNAEGGKPFRGPVRSRDTLEQMAAITRGFTGKRLTLKNLVGSPDVPVPQAGSDVF